MLIPVAYYVHRRGLSQRYREAVADARDREAVRTWTLRSLIVPGVWGSGLDSLLRDLRQTIDRHGQEQFPADELERRMAARGKSLAITPEQVEDILDLSYTTSRTFAVLALLFPHVNTRNVHHVDHVFPQTLLSRKKLRQSGFDREAVDGLMAMRDKLPNLQLLEGGENLAKSDTPPAQWARTAFQSPDRYQAYLDRNELPMLPSEVAQFSEFFNARRAALAQRITSMLGGTVPLATADPVTGDTDTPLDASIDEELAEAAYVE